MSISPDITSGPYTANGSQTAFPFTFTALSGAEVAVTVNGVAVVSGFTVTITAAPDNGGTVNFTVAPTAGAVVLLTSAPDYLQDSQFGNQSAYNLSTVDQINRRATVKALVTKKKLEAVDGTVAAGYAAAARADRLLADADVLLSHADVTTTHSDVALTHADVTTANASRDAAILAAATNGVYPNTAATNVPRGLTQASVGAITAGSGGTNGTFALAWSGGNFDINPTGTFTVAGGALTAVTITGPGLRIGSTATVPTPSFAASSGLTSAAVALTAQFLVANGAGYWVQSADNSELDRYTNVSGTATAVAGVGPIPISANTGAINLAEAQVYAQAIKSAVGTGSLKALFDMDGPRTAYSASPTIMTALTSLDDTPLTLSLYSTIYSGTDPRPVYTARGIYLSSGSGLQTTSPIFSKTSGDFAFLHAIDLNTVTSTVSLQSSLPGSPADGDMVLVNADRNVRTGLGTDVKTVLDTAWTTTDLVNGYFKWNNYNALWEGATFLMKATGPSGSRFEVSITHLGQLTVFMYDGTNASSLISKGNVLMGQSKVTFGIRRKGSNIFLILNGRVIYGVGSALVNITDLNQWYVNGSSRQAATAQPVINGLRHYFRGMCVADDLTDACFQDVYNTFAHRHATPALVRPRAMRGIATEGQSWTLGSTTVTDSWRAGPNNWDGMVTPNNATYAQEANSVTREAFSNFFAPKDQDNPGDIAPYAVQVDASGNVTASHNIGGSGENFLAGFAKQLNQHSVGAASDFIVSGTGQGGASIAILSFQSTVPLVQQLKTIPLTGSDYYNKMLRQIVYARDFALSRGQTYTLDVMMWQQGHTDGNNAAYLTALYAVHDRFAADVKAITGQSHNPIWLSPQITYSSDGTTNGTNSGTGVIDQLFLDMEDGRGTRPMYCIGPMYQITNFIHPYRAGHRWIGEIFGRAFTQIVFDGESYGCLRPYAYTYSIGGTTIDIDYRVRAGRALTLSQTNDNNIYTVVANQGFDFTDASAGGVTISSVAVTSGTRIRVTLSGAIGAGDTIRYAGALRFGNVADGAKVNGVYPDQDWTATFVSNEPPFGNGNVNDLRQWAAASRKVL